MANKGQNGGGNKTRTAYRSADDGRFMTKAQAARKPAKEVVKERVPVPGRGDTR